MILNHITAKSMDKNILKKKISSKIKESKKLLKLRLFYFLKGGDSIGA